MQKSLSGGKLVCKKCLSGGKLVCKKMFIWRPDPMVGLRGLGGGQN